jgi:GNAT superfamily N-acetyltransferase
MRIRIAVPTDVPAIFDVRTSVLENHMSVEELARIGITPDTVVTMLSGDGRGWVADEGGKIVAFSMADAGNATVFAMFVQPGHERRGLGRALLNEAERWLFARGSEEIWLLTDRNPQVRANGFYQHLGWKNDGIQKDGQVRYIKRAAAV